MNNLCIDIGNTKVKIAIFTASEQKIVYSNQDNWFEIEKISHLVQTWHIENAIISTVRQAEKQWEAALQELIKGKVIFLNENTPCPIENLYHSPKTLGKDRLAAVVGAWALYPNKKVLVIDAGTCIKYDYINEKGQYLGGSISPGLKMRYEALQYFTAKLPLLSAQSLLPSITGIDTASSMHTGVGYGFYYEAKGFIEHYKAEKGEDMLVVFSGGDLSFFENMLNNCIFAQPNLLLIGLHQILQYNV